MFFINYILLDEDIEELSNVKDIKDFETNMNGFVGQIYLLFANNSIGFIDKDIPYNGDFVADWLEILNKVLVYLNKYGFATMYEPDTNNVWLEFYLLDNEIEVRYIRVEQQKVVLSHIEKSKKKCVELFWCDKIGKNEFYDGILKVTNDFINEVKSINTIITESNEFLRVLVAYRRALEIL